MIGKILKALGVLVGLAVISAGGFYLWAVMTVSGKVSTIHDFPKIGIADAMPSADVEIGRRIVEIRTACVDCHGKDLGGKVYMDNPPMGKYYGTNITPAGIGKLSDEDVARAIYYGIKPDGTPLLFMPAEDYHKMSLGDIANVIAYLRSIPPVERPNEQSHIGPVATILGALGKMPILFSAEFVDKNPPSTEKPAEAATVEFGKYLVDTTCTGCHGADLRGGPIPGGDPSWPPATSLRSDGLAGWKKEDFISSMQTGISPGNKPWRDPMKPLAEYTKQLNETELDAMWAYLETQK